MGREVNPRGRPTGDANLQINSMAELKYSKKPEQAHIGSAGKIHGVFHKRLGKVATSASTGDLPSKMTPPIHTGKARPSSSPGKIEWRKKANKKLTTDEKKEKALDENRTPAEKRIKRLDAQMTHAEKKKRAKLEVLCSRTPKNKELILKVHYDHLEIKIAKRNKAQYVSSLSHTENFRRVQDEWDTPLIVRNYIKIEHGGSSNITPNSSDKSDTSSVLSRVSFTVSSRVGEVFKSISDSALNAMYRISPLLHRDRQVGVITDDISSDLDE